MKNLICKILRLLLCVLPTASLVAQKHFVLTVKLPPGAETEKMEVWLEKGKGGRVERIKSESNREGILLLKGEYYSRYAAISLQYPGNSSSQGFSRTFFIQEKPGSITFYPTSSLTSFGKYSLKNVADFEAEKKRLDAFTSIERKKATNYEAQYGDKVYSGPDTAVRNYYFNVLIKNFRKKEMEYVLKNSESYYSFYVFRSDVASSNLISPDSLLIVYNRFPDRFKYSDEGNYVHEAILGMIPTKMNTAAIDFVASDINKKKIVLSSFKGKKYVLLQFWATWCTPCKREIAALKEINDRYSSKGLQIISIGLKSSYPEYVKAINKEGMKWIHIYDDVELLNKYGNQPVPRICLIDLSGKMVYDKLGLGNDNDYQLRELNQLLTERIK